ncbi:MULTISPECIES: hypothetical protein [unclassified Rhizobium]|uniref:hypothetical protein n=1 Tax=unclassified Rhizobium TaxID=2613769 RepID=UPI001607FA73|nr:MULTISPECIES: hypothetical protein [unclassified Rhizobium]MBB3318848.1 hypothetical protein [Rhizobium sp. BK181]MBB3545516.1 hypothetical protein [Rhizobium sp. BK399]MCS3744378.1 hypothetical protein [Rhizobium sp. BK661]MCS4096706.1 hypothetical protein [Rhizobium sp. BK176]
MHTLPVIADVQIERALASPAKFADNPFRTWALDALQRRNATLDAVFYDVNAVTPEEIPDVAFWLAREGAVILVPPSGEGRLKVFLTPEDFLRHSDSANALAIAGVGSSALGAAAFARNVADGLGEPVAAVVSGYGLADVLTEALGGFFWFGALNSIRHVFEPIDAFTKMFSSTEQLEHGYLWTRTSQDTETVISLLEDKRFAPRFLVGHSKGNLVLSEALYAIVDERPDLAEQLSGRSRIVTISAKVGMPSLFRDVVDVMGEWDWFGALNSRPDIPADITVPNAWHSTNPAFPIGTSINVAKTIESVRTKFQRAPVAMRAANLSKILDAPQRTVASMRSRLQSDGRENERW